MNNRILFGIAGIAILLYFFIYNLPRTNQVPNSDAGTVHVVASFYPLGEFARNIGNDLVQVTVMVPAGVEPHDFEPTPQDVVTIQTSDMFIYNGAGFEAWAERLLDDIDHTRTVVVNGSVGISLLTADGKAYDPHIWLDPVRAIQMVDHIAEGFVQADPEHAELYRQQAKKYMQKLTDLDRDFQEGLSQCEQRDVIVAHDAFGYLADRYNLNIISLSGLSPDDEPSPQKMADIVQFAKDHNVRYIFFESLVSPRLSETIAQEVGVETLVLHPLEGATKEDINAGKDYISLQEENLLNLKKALRCI